MRRCLHILAFATCLVAWHVVVGQDDPTDAEIRMSDNCKAFEDGGFCLTGDSSEENRSVRNNRENQLKEIFGEDGSRAAMFSEASRDPYTPAEEEEEEETTRRRRTRPARNRPSRSIDKAKSSVIGDELEELDRSKRQIVDLTLGQPYVTACRERCWTQVLRWWDRVYVPGRGWLRVVYWPPVIMQTLTVCIPCHRLQTFCRGATREIWGYRRMWLGRCVPEVKYKLILVWWSYTTWPYVRWVWVRYPQGCCCVPWPYGLPRSQWNWTPQQYEQSPAYATPRSTFRASGERDPALGLTAA